MDKRTMNDVDTTNIAKALREFAAAGGHGYLPESLIGWAEQLEATEGAAVTAVSPESEAQMVCLETYQIVSIMLSDLGYWYSDNGQNLLTNLSLGKRIHKDLLPWPSLK